MQAGMNRQLRNISEEFFNFAYLRLGDKNNYGVPLWMINASTSIK